MHKDGGARTERLPEAFLKRMKTLLGEQYGLFLAAEEEEPVKAVYLQGSRLSADVFEKQKRLRLTPMPHLPGGYYCGADKPGNDPLHAAGAYYVQDPSAMLPVSASPLKPGMRCLDLCASPGGKSAQIRDRIGETGFLVSNEIMPSRCKTLAGNLERIGAPNTLVTNASPRQIAAWYPSFFDFILADAPCSGEGMFRKYPESVSEWNEGLPPFCAARQKDLLSEAVKALSPGGYLMYSTCTFSEEENESVIRDLMEREPGLELCALPGSVQSVTSPGIGMPEARRFYPFLAPGEGQFMALLRKAGEPGERRVGFRDARSSVGRTEMDAAVSFLEDAVDGFRSLPLCGYGGKLVAADFPLPPCNVYAPGVTVGEISNRRLIPHHALFKVYGYRFFRKWELAVDAPEERLLEAYLSGAELDCPLADGWGVVTTLGCPVGGVKIAGGKAKNHYPKGLRKSV